MENNFHPITIYGRYIYADTDLSSDVRTMKDFFWTFLKRII